MAFNIALPLMESRHPGCKRLNPKQSTMPADQPTSVGHSIAVSKIQRRQGPPLRIAATPHHRKPLEPLSIHRYENRVAALAEKFTSEA